MNTLTYLLTAKPTNICGVYWFRLLMVDWLIAFFWL